MSYGRNRVEIFSLLNFKRLAENESNHADLLADFRIMQYIERGLDTSDEEAIKTCLSTLELLVENRKNHDCLKKLTSIKVSLQNLAERRFGADTKDKLRAEKLIKNLDGSFKPSNKEKLTWPRKIVTLHVVGLHNGTRKELEDILTKKIKGVLTVAADVEHQRCTLTVYSHVELDEIAEAIQETGYMFAYHILKNNKNQEILVPILEQTPTPEPVHLPEYLDEEDDVPVGPQAVRTRDFRVAASEWFLTTANFLQRSMYW